MTIDIADLNRQRTEEISALVGTGAVFTVGPDSVLRRLGIEPTATRIFEYAGRKRTELGVAQALVTVDGRDTATWVIFGEDESGEALLRAYTLEGVFLNVEPPNQRLFRR